MKQKLLASLKNTDTGENCVVAYTERVSLSLLKIVFDVFGMAISKKAHQLITNHVVLASALSLICEEKPVEFL